MWFYDWPDHCINFFEHNFFLVPKLKVHMKMYLETQKHFGPECKTSVSASNSTFGSKTKMCRFALNIL